MSVACETCKGYGQVRDKRGDTVTCEACNGTGYSVPPPKLPSPSMRLHEVTMAALNKPHAEPESAVEISRNAKGDFQFTVTVRGHEAEACESTANGIVERLRAMYPHSSETNGDDKPAADAVKGKQTQTVQGVTGAQRVKAR